MGFVPYTHQGWHYTYGFAFGGTFFDEAACAVTPDEAGVVAGHQWVYDYTARHSTRRRSTPSPVPTL